MTPAFLTLTQWLSPAFPTGAFAYGHGLETAIALGQLADAPSLQAWLSDILRFGAGRQDAVLLAHALHPDADLEALNATARALAPCAERLQETMDLGAALARTIAGITGRPLPARALPIALAEAARPLALPPDTVIALFLQSFVGNLTTIACRAVPLGQTQAQAALANLAPLIARLAQDAAHATLDDLGTTTLAADLAAVLHETQDVRIYRT